MFVSSAARRLRCLLVWSAATALVGGLHLVLLRDLLERWPDPFDQVLVRVAEAALLSCATWLWMLTTLVVAEALLARDGHHVSGVPGVPRAVRRLVLAACGTAVIAGMTGPALATAGESGAAAHALVHTAGDLPFPDRLPSPPQQEHSHGRPSDHDDQRNGDPERHPERHPKQQGDTHDDRDQHTGHVVVVRSGQSLWSIASDELGAGATPAQVAAQWPRIYAHNRATIGTDPALIEPGQHLVLPGEES